MIAEVILKKITEYNIVSMKYLNYKIEYTFRIVKDKNSILISNISNNSNILKVIKNEIGVASNVSFNLYKNGRYIRSKNETNYCKHSFNMKFNYKTFNFFEIKVEGGYLNTIGIYVSFKEFYD